MIPSRLTWNLQSLDISINKVLKENLRKKYINDCIKTNNAKVLKSTIIEWVDEIWNSESVITNEMIFNSFKYLRINCSLDASEDYMFRGYEDLEKEAKL